MNFSYVLLSQKKTNKNNKLKTKKMKTLIETTTGTISSQMILDHCGDYACKFQDEAFAIFQEIWDSEINSWDGNQWMDIMFDEDGDVYAIWAEDALTCQNAWCFYIQLDREDCSKAFAEMDKKRETNELRITKH